jgi:hypothetical protein
LSPTIGNSSRDVDKSLRIKGLHLDGLAKVLRGTGLVGDRASFSGCRLAWPPVTPHLRQPRISRHRIRLGIETAPLGWLLVSRIVAGNDRARTLTGILTSWSRGRGRGSSGGFSNTRRRGIN